MHHSFSAGVRLAFPLLAAGDGYSSKRKKSRRGRVPGTRPRRLTLQRATPTQRGCPL